MNKVQEQIAKIRRGDRDAVLGLDKYADTMAALLKDKTAWDYYQTLVKENGYQGITDLLAKHDALLKRLELLEKVRELSMNEWTKELPTKFGWYWWRALDHSFLGPCKINVNYAGRGRGGEWWPEPIHPPQ